MEASTCEKCREGERGGKEGRKGEEVSSTALTSTSSTALKGREREGTNLILARHLGKFVKFRRTEKGRNPSKGEMNVGGKGGGTKRIRGFKAGRGSFWIVSKSSSRRRYLLGGSCLFPLDITPGTSSAAKTSWSVRSSSNFASPSIPGVLESNHEGVCGSRSYKITSTYVGSSREESKVERTGEEETLSSASSQSSLSSFPSRTCSTPLVSS